MFKRIRRRKAPSRLYNFYVWENGRYVSVNGEQFVSDDAATQRAFSQVKHAVPPRRPTSLDAPHLHVVRADGIHVITIEMPETQTGVHASRDDAKGRRLRS